MKKIILIAVGLISTSCQYFQKVNDPHAEIQIGHYIKLRQLNPQQIIWNISQGPNKIASPSDTIFKYPGQVISLYQSWDKNLDGNNYYNVRDGWGHVYQLPIENFDDRGLKPYIDPDCYNNNQGLLK